MRDPLVVAGAPSGQPEGSVILTSPEVPDRWRITEYALYQPDLGDRRDPGTIPLRLEALDSAGELRPGARLLEEIDC